MKKAEKILVAMSGGVDSSVAAAVLIEEGFDVTGVTMKLWGGSSDTGCCSVSDVIDARRVADQLGIPHHVFNFGDEFDAHVVEPYVAAHAIGETPNPCIECNRHVKFDKLFRRANALGFDMIATGHHAQITEENGNFRIMRSVDQSKDQSYVLHMLTQDQLQKLRFPIGTMTKKQVREKANALSLQTAGKADSQDVCFISRTKGGRQLFLEERLEMTSGQVIDTTGTKIAEVEAVEMVTIGQRKGLGVSGERNPRYAIDVDVQQATVTVGSKDDLFCQETPIVNLHWVGNPDSDVLDVQTSAHGKTSPARVDGRVIWEEPRMKVAPGQSVVFYKDNEVVGSATATKTTV
ncbi:MAG: tRNA 2-thiouridine(34) synthase MnmA [Actinomycetota bacterium]|nr:tRNA 2-thiouridine(34) synthase MnmA [Actinomycetota bacterium]